MTHDPNVEVRKDPRGLRHRVLIMDAEQAISPKRPGLLP